MSPAPGLNTTSRELPWTAILIAGLAALLCVRLAALYWNATDLFFDEAQYWAWSEQPAFGYFSKPPLVAWLIRVATEACGPGEACVRLPSPFLHTLTAIAVFFLGRRLYDARVGALSALAFATLPGVSLSAGLISTDVPLLTCWAIALVGFAALFETDRLWPALVIAWRASMQRLPEPDRYLLAFSAPILIVITLEAFISRAHANWAAPAYVAGAGLVIATMVRDGAWSWLKVSFAINVALLLLLALGTTTAGRLPNPVGSDPFARTLGWHDVAQATEAELAKARAAGHPFAAVLSDDRAMTAELLYYMRGEATPVLAWRKGAPHDHFELTRPFTAATTGPVLLVREGTDAGPAAGAFASADQFADLDLPAGDNARRRVTFYVLSGYKAQ